LSVPPSRGGQRLRSERELAELLGVSRTSIRSALGELEKRSLINRQAGSGTYVRKVPVLDGAALAALAAGLDLDPATLFAEDQNAGARGANGSPDQELCVAVFNLQPSESRSFGLIQNGIMAQAEEHAHRVVCIDGPADGEQIDGFIVHVDHADLFAQAFPGQHRVTYVGPGYDDMEFEPIVHFDRLGTMTRALRILADAGFTRIGLVSHDDEHNIEKSWRHYFNVMAGLGLNYYAPVSGHAGTGDAKPAVERLLDRDDAPDALFVDDDVILYEVMDVLAPRGLRPGEDLGMVTLANYGSPLPDGIAWSRMEFNPTQMGRLLMDCLLREITCAGEPLCSFAHQAAWRPGATHGQGTRRQEKDRNGGSA
jgi:DNA-binding LacI/PurR family transcriptional regulator